MRGVERQQPKRWWAIAGAAALALVAGWSLPHRSPDVSALAPAVADATPPSVAAAPSAAPSPAVVYVSGAVRSPGVYTLTPGKRVIDALKAAGGAVADADLARVNLASPLTDGEQIGVPKRGESLEPVVGPTNAGPSSTRRHSRRHSSTPRSGGAHKLSPGETLDVNTAGADELVRLPGVGPSLAQRIVEYRNANGRFEAVDDLQNVPGIGASKFEHLAPFVRL